ncbi:creatininase family protein [Bosea sp. R86505]|uniref:creatininase family protein n=1 Tax=Bosea sp. R86505 TaxID=3101710 RepID=UPI003672B483
MTSVLWNEMTAEELRAKAAADAIVVLPVASVEQHGPHLPVGVDTILCERICKAAAERVDGNEVVVAPTVWCGMAEHHMAFGGTFTFDIPTYRAVLLCLLKNLERHGFRRVVIVNGHSGNTSALMAFLPDFACETKLRVRAAMYFSAADRAVMSVLEDATGTHANEFETSMMMALAPELVRDDRLRDAFGGQEPERKGAPILKRTARHRSFKDKTDSCVIGDARRANAKKGTALVEECVRSLAAILSHERV